MDRIKRIAGAVLGLAGLTIGGAQAYYVRELAPGWPPQFHARPAAATEFVQIPLDRLQHIGLVLVLAILCLLAVALGLGGKAK